MRGGGESLMSARGAGAGWWETGCSTQTRKGHTAPPCWEQLCRRARTWAVRCQQLELRGRGRFASCRVAWPDPWGQPESLRKQVCPRCFLDRKVAVRGMSRGREWGLWSSQRPAAVGAAPPCGEQARGCPPISSHLLGSLRAALQWVGSTLQTQQI